MGKGKNTDCARAPWIIDPQKPQKPHWSREDFNFNPRQQAELLLHWDGQIQAGKPLAWSSIQHDLAAQQSWNRVTVEILAQTHGHRPGEIWNRIDTAGSGESGSEDPGPQPGDQGGGDDPDGPNGPDDDGGGDGEDPYRRMVERLNIVAVNSDQELDQLMDRLYRSGDRTVELDYETGSIAPEHGALRLVQIGFTDEDGQDIVALIDLFDIDDRSRLAEMLGDPDIQKRIHHADFERRWSHFHFGTEIRNVLDTELAFKTLRDAVSKIDDPAEQERIWPGWAQYQAAEEARKHEARAQGQRAPRPRSNLAHTCHSMLGITLPKEEQVSDWEQPELSPSQRTYAAMDVAVLKPVGDRLDAALDRLGPGVREQLQTKTQAQHDTIDAAWRIDQETGDVLHHGTDRDQWGNARRARGKVWYQVRDRSHRIFHEIQDADSPQALQQARVLARRLCICWFNRQLLETAFRERAAQLSQA